MPLAKKVEQSLGQLEAILKALMLQHDELLVLLKDKRSAISQARRERLGELCKLENQRVQVISELEKKRLRLVAEVTLMIEPGAGEPMALMSLAMKVGEPFRGRLLVLRHQLRQKMQQVRDKSTALRDATQSIVSHMDGLMQSIGSIMTGVATYGRDGQRPRSATAVSTFDMKV